MDPSVAASEERSQLDQQLENIFSNDLVNDFSFIKLYRQLRVDVPIFNLEIAHLRAMNTFLAYAYDPHTMYITVEDWANESPHKESIVRKNRPSAQNKNTTFVNPMDLSLAKISPRDATSLANAVQAIDELTTLGSNSLGQKIKLISITDFDLVTDWNLLENQIFDLGKRGFTGVILDLRGNLGGNLLDGQKLSSFFLGPKSALSYEIILRPSPIIRFRPSQKKLTRLPTVILANANSASTSEIVIGALRDYRRAFIIGQRTFGKGTSQVFHSEEEIAPGLVFLATNARIYQPSGSSNQYYGINPDFEVPLTKYAKIL